LLLLGFALQAHFAATHPQPPLFGDPHGYQQVGRRMVAAWQRWRGGESWEDALGSVRGVLYFAGTGLVYGLADAWRPGDLLFLRLVFAGFNTLSMLGGFFLARRLSGGFAGGLLALAALVAHPSFAVELAKLFPDPITGCCFTWATVAFVEAVARGRARLGVGAGVAVGAGLFVRSQLLVYVVPLLALACAVGAWLDRERRFSRRLALGVLLGVIPFAALWGAITHIVGPDVGEIEALGNFTFKSRYPYGFWQFLDSDGWMGPYRLRAEPYYQALEVDAAERGWPLSSRLQQWAFTARYVGSRPFESLALLLDNAYRLFDRPPNRYKWDYPYSYGVQVAAHRTLMLLALLGLVVFASVRRAYLAVFFLPASIALLHALSYPWPRFAQPVLPVLLASAGAFLGWALEHRRGCSWPRAGLVRIGAVAACALMLVVLGALFRDGAPEAARWARLVATLLAVGLPFLALAELRTAGLSRRSLPAIAAVVWLALAAGVAAHDLRSPAWHQTETVIGTANAAGVEQEIWPSDEARQRLRAAAEAFLVADLRISGNELPALDLEVNGRAFRGTDLVGTLPRLGEFTLEGGPDRNSFAQWWMLRLPADLRSAGEGPLRVRVLGGSGTGTVVYGDRFEGDQAVYDGPSFGDWPHVAGIKFDYDGDPRLPVRLPLASSRTVSAVLHRDGRREPVRGVFRIRILLLTANEGSVAWETAAVPAGRAALRFSATHGNAGAAELLVQGRPIASLPLGKREDYTIAAPPYALCYRSQAGPNGPARGTFLLSGPFEPGLPVQVLVRFRAAMSDERLFFLPDRASDAPVFSCPLEPGVALVDGMARVLDSSRARYPQQTGRWRVLAVS
jgi:hypothetical protein